MLMTRGAMGDAFRRMRRDRKGNVAIIFGLCLLPTIGLIGLGVDYSMASMAKRKLDAAADAAVLNAVSRSSNPQLSQPSQDQASAAFYAALGRASNITVSNIHATSAYVDGSLQVQVTYQAAMPTSFGSLFNVPTISLSGTSSSTAARSAYSNFYLLLDNSPSMGLGATTADISKLQAATGGCAFACHEHTFDNAAHINGDSPTDFYQVAKNIGAKTRIDMLRTASQQIFKTAINLDPKKERYQAAIYTFNDVVETVASLSHDLSAVQTQAAAVDLDYSFHDHRNSQTAYDTALTHMTNVLGTGGNGQTASSPFKYLLMITDGVEDEATGTGSGSGNQPDHFAAPNQTQTWPPSTAMQNIANTYTANVSAGGTRLITTLNPAQCDKLKANNVQIAILYTTYLPVTTDNLYNERVKPISDQIASKLQQCASPNLFFTVDPTQDITTAMNSMFYAVAVGEPRLAN